jgi:hypothetical protein
VRIEEELKDLKSKAEMNPILTIYNNWDSEDMKYLTHEYDKETVEPFLIAQLAFKFEWTIICHLLNGCNSNHEIWLCFSQLRYICKRGPRVKQRIFKNSQDIMIVKKKWRDLDEQLCLDNRVYYAVRYFKKAGYIFAPPFTTVQELKQVLNFFSVYDEELLLIASRMIRILESFNVNSLRIGVSGM